jgi:predicted nucleotidyltransferase
MRLQDVEAILRALNDAEVRYLIVGGLAVVAHGYVRATVDLDIVVDLERENILRAVRALENIGYSPLVPVRAEEFADATKRQCWIDEKNMTVFQMRHADPKSPRVDIFVKEPFSFSDELAAAKWEEVAGIRAPVLRLERLLEMKRAAGRPADLLDIEQLETIMKNPKK